MRFNFASNTYVYVGNQSIENDENSQRANREKRIKQEEAHFDNRSHQIDQLTGTIGHLQNEMCRMRYGI